MAKSRYVPKNIKKYKPKTFWGFTGREILSILASLVVIVLTFAMTKSLATETRIYIASVPAIFPLLIGFVRPYGIPLEKFIPEMYFDMFRHSQKRFRITAPSLHIKKEKTAVKLNNKNKPLAVAKKKK